jgi:hypothetical protein
VFTELPWFNKETYVMAVEARIRELGSRHQTLERMIQDEVSRPVADDVKLKELKRRKLKLKEEMEALRAQSAH